MRREPEYAISNRSIYTSLWYTVGYFNTMVRIPGINAFELLYLHINVLRIYAYFAAFYILGNIILSMFLS